ncbi:hypothetical protein V6C42_00515 [Pseudoclostridium thermosuccinogenes]|jgi:hypothetical protein|uniref:hypothetical protein n=1 Tax=Clostridium thermosuccinogenes TaxID=84032 RepID=UPI000CCC019C|nr:hypothetical protein [Pseudoclostridium thermosuccinogenes]PNT91145.1 hypothetical protein CDQ83_15135 [Pseudoclostridium thermosuccinogenes]
MVTVIYIIKFTVKLLMLIIMSPFILIWFLVRYLSYKAALTQSLIEAGVPADSAKELARETGLCKIFK